MIILLEKSLLLMSSAIVSFWVVIWVMHICALVNAKMKLNKTNHYYQQQQHPNQYNATQSTTNIPVVGPTANKVAIHQQNKDAHLDSSSMEDKLLLHVPINQHDRFGVIDPHDAYLKHAHFLHPNTDSNNNNNNNNININNCNYSIIDYSSSYSQPSALSTSAPCDQSQYCTSYPSPFSTAKGMINHCNSYISLPLPGVSIIKPLVGVDKNLHANLETFFCMDYPAYELLFCVQDPEDAAILIVKNLFKLYPEVDAKLFTGGSRVGVNPKINNMQPAYEAVKYELVLVSDSGISMKKDTLLDMVIHMNEDVALVHQMPFVSDEKGTGFQSVVEKVYFGTAHARAYLTADLLNINCPTGMSALMRKYLLDEVGGIKAFGQYLAEDFFFAKSFTDRGWKISICSQPAWQNTANSGDTLNTLNGRIQRWIKLRYAMVPHWTFMEPFSECLLLGFLGAISISFLWAIDPIAIFIFHIVIWLAFDYTLLCTIQNGPLKFSISQFLMAWLMRESTALLIFTKALADRNLVTWRSRVFRLKYGGHAEEIFLDKQDVVDTTITDTFPITNTTKSGSEALAAAAAAATVMVADTNLFSLGGEFEQQESKQPPPQFHCITIGAYNDENSNHQSGGDNSSDSDRVQQAALIRARTATENRQHRLVGDLDDKITNQSRTKSENSGKIDRVNYAQFEYDRLVSRVFDMAKGEQQQRSSPSSSASESESKIGQPTKSPSNDLHLLQDVFNRTNTSLAVL